MSDEFLLALLSLTTYRITWLITRDSFPPVRRIRELIKNQAFFSSHKVSVDENGDKVNGGEYEDDRGPWASVAELSTCPWCVSVWISAGVVGTTHGFHTLEFPFLWFGAVAAIAALIACVVDKIQD